MSAVSVGPPSGVLILDKPRGPTSHDIVAQVRRALHTREVGHAGTLDPMASGVLLVAIGEATKLVPWLTATSKAYEATIALGIETDTLDAEGRETRRATVSQDLRHALSFGPPSYASAMAQPGPNGSVHARGWIVPPLIRSAIDAEIMRTEQVPPAFSAIRLHGERAYVAARRGETVPLAARPVAVRSIDLLACCAEPPSLLVALEVTKGYYVRALARDLSAALGTVGHLTSLRRTRSGPFGLDQATAADAPPATIAGALQPVARAAALALPVARLTPSGARDARFGKRVHPQDIEPATDIVLPAPSAWLDDQGELVAVGCIEPGGGGRVLRGFAPARP